MTNRPWIAERTAQINADADAISDLAVGDGVSVSLWSDIEAYTIVKRTATTITLRQDFAELLNAADLRFIPGGFSAHCENQADQVYAYLPNADGHEVKITLRRWKDEEGSERRKWKRAGTRTFEGGGNAYAGRRKFHDFNF